MDSLAVSLGGKVVRRSTNLWTLMKKDTNAGFKELRKGYKTFDNYVNNGLARDLEWFGEQIAKEWDHLVCGNAPVQNVMVFGCSKALSAIVCAATGGAAPGCLNTLNQTTGAKLMAKLESKVLGDAIHCAVFHALEGLKKLDSSAFCDGRRAGIAMQFTDLAMRGDPYKAVCKTGISCSCHQCPWQCSHRVKKVCLGKNWKIVAKEAGKTLTLASRTAIQTAHGG
mmetsp:Transcript_42752/g.68736  ORF Transcript_42752/g.68736 Transcript_42752/m.68736 type:complete len:225 (-) Transcript_42752:218-892(-)